MTHKQFLEEMHLLLRTPLHELNDTSLLKLRHYLLSVNRDIESELNDRQQVLQRCVNN